MTERVTWVNSAESRWVVETGGFGQAKYTPELCSEGIL
jgi:hypothetical protein